MSTEVAERQPGLDADLAASSVGRVLGEGGAFARCLPDFRPRLGQQRMAAAVEAALRDGHHLLVEAGTGIGKTFAYLVPALLSGKRIVISTATRALQDQLFQRDLPEVCRVLRLNPRVALLKGRANYLCQHRFERTLAAGGGTLAERSMLGKLDAWRQQSASGDLAECAFLPEDAPLRPRVTSTSDNCLGSGCPRLAECFVVRARRQAQEARIVVVNHHLLLADFRLREGAFGELLPVPEAVIVDEAHAFSGVAFEAFGEQLSSFQITSLLADLKQATDLAGLPGLRPALEEPVSALSVALQELNEALAQCSQEKGAREALIVHQGFARSLEGLEQALAGLAAALTELAPGHPDLARLGERAAELAARTQAWRQGVSPSATAGDAPASAGDGHEDGVFAWYQRSERGFRLSTTPASVAAALARWREALRIPWIFTSATLAVAGSFRHLEREWGLEGAVRLAIDSPFDYAKNALLYVPSDLREPRQRDQHRQALFALAMRLLAASRGRAFLLFTAHETLGWFAAEFAKAKQAGHFRWTLLVQGERAAHQLIEAFQADGHAVLLGTASFWEGVDVPGQALSLVIIDKLPFPSPEEPVRQARARAIENRDGDAFRELDLPEAVMALRQGAGRLIRRESDRGVLVIADPRLRTMPYGKAFLSSLPPMRRVESEQEVLEFLGAIA